MAAKPHPSEFSITDDLELMGKLVVLFHTATDFTDGLMAVVQAVERHVHHQYTEMIREALREFKEGAAKLSDTIDHLEVPDDSGS